MSLAISHRTIVQIIAVIAAAAALAGYAAHLNGGTLDFSDTEARVVVSGSMDGEPRSGCDIATIPTGSLVLIRPVEDWSSLEVGDVLTFDYIHPASHEAMVVTHRIVDISESGGAYTYTLMGDSIADDPTNGSVQVVASDSGDIHGEVVGVSHWLGVLVRFLSTWTGRMCLVLAPCIIFIVSEVRSIVRTLRGDAPREDAPAHPGAESEGPLPVAEESSASSFCGIRGIADRIIVPRRAGIEPEASEDSGPDGPVFIHRRKADTDERRTWNEETGDSHAAAGHHSGGRRGGAVADA